MAAAIDFGAQGLGCMGLSWAYSTALQNSTEDKEDFLRQAISHGVRLFNTSGNIYTGAAGSNEELIGRAFKFVISTKFGIELPSWRNNIAADKVRGHFEAAAARLQVDFIDVFMICRIGKDILCPIEETMKGLKVLVEEGKIGGIGLNKPTVSQIKRAHAVHPIACVEHEYSVFSRGIEDSVLPVCRELGIKVLCYSPVGGGVMKVKKGEEAAPVVAPDDASAAPAPAEAPLEDAPDESKLAPLAKLEEECVAAARRGCSANQLALAWLHAQGPHVIPIPGTTRIAHLVSNMAGAKVSLSADEAKVLGDAIAAAYIGPRSPPRSSY